MRLRFGLFVLLALLVGPGLAHARPSRDESPAVAHEARLLDRTWSWLVSVFQKAGSFIDPAGTLLPSVAHPSSNSVQIDAGSFIDPAGGS
jgi:hypothetical protein